MDTSRDIRDFLATRRARITPEQVGLPVVGHGKRRVPGLRREEVALLADVSVDYYVRLKRGRIAGASEKVLDDALCRALQLDDAERSHLHDLAAAQRQRPARRTPRRAKDAVPASLKRVLESMTGSPTFIRNGRLDILASSPTGTPRSTPPHRGRPSPGRHRTERADRRARHSQRPVPCGLGKARCAPAPHRPQGVRPSGHRRDHARLRRHGTSSPPGLALTAYSAEPGTPDHDALILLASWAATSSDGAHQDASRP